MSGSSRPATRRWPVSPAKELRRRGRPGRHDLDREGAGGEAGFAEGTVTISAVSAEAGRAVEELDVDYAGESLEIGFNARYILDMLQQIDGDEVRLRDGERGGTHRGARPGGREHALRADAHAGMNALPLARASRAATSARFAALAVRRLELARFPQLRAAAARAAARPGRAARRQRCRQDQPARGGLAAEPRAAACAGRGSPSSTASGGGAWRLDALRRRPSRARSRSRPATSARPSGAVLDAGRPAAARPERARRAS